MSKPTTTKNPEAKAAPTTSASEKDAAADRQHDPGFLERAGVNYYSRLAQKRSRRYHTADELPDDDTLRKGATRITIFGGVIAFVIGMISTIGSVWVEVEFEQKMDWYSYYSLQGGVTVVLVGIEFLVLFWVAMQTVHRLSILTGTTHIENEPLLPGKDKVPNLLARAALEIPDPVVNFLGIDPLRHVSRRKLLLLSLLYKAKIFLTNTIAKFVLRRMFGKSLMRVSVSWIAVPITGAWNWVVLWRVAREARLRLFGYWLAKHISKELLTAQKMGELSPLAREGAVRAVANMVVLTQRYHPNMMMLLVRICHLLEIDKDKQYDDWQEFLTILRQVSRKERNFLLDLLSVAAAFDGRLSRLERQKLPEAFGEHTEAYYDRIRTLKKLLMNGRLHEARAYCELDFEPG